MYSQFVDRAKNGEISGYLCKKCGGRSIKGSICPFCGSRELESEKAPNEGKIVTCTKIHVAPPEFSSDAPYTVALIELSNGLRVMGRVTGDADIGRAVRFSGTRESSLGISLVFEVKD